MSLADHLDERWIEERLLSGETVMIEMDGALISLRPPVFSRVERTDLRELGHRSRRTGLMAEAEHCVWWIEVKDRKSRIVMKDGEAMVEVQDFLRAREEGKAVVLWLVTSAPVCSKTLQFLGEHGMMLTRVDGRGAER